MNYSRFRDLSGYPQCSTPPLEYLSSTSFKADSKLHQSGNSSRSSTANRSFSPIRDFVAKADIVPSSGKLHSKVRPPSFADEMTTISSSNFETPVKDKSEVSVEQLKRIIKEEIEERKRAEVLITQLRRKLAKYEERDEEILRLKSELKQLKFEREQHKDLKEIRNSRERSFKDNQHLLEETVTELKSELRKKTEEVHKLKLTIETSAEQRSELLKESELLRQTLVELKHLHRREIAELKGQFANECALRAASDRKLAEMYLTESPVCAMQLKSQVEKIEGKLLDLEVKHRQQLAASYDIQDQVEELTNSYETQRRHGKGLKVLKENVERKSPQLSARAQPRKRPSKSPMRPRIELYTEYE